MTGPDLAREQRRRALERLLQSAYRHPWTGQDVVHARHALDTDAILEPGRKTRLLLTLDIGYHASGWWKNSDYHRCLHLSVSHPILLERRVVGRDVASEHEVRAWARAIFGEHVKWSWFEPPADPLDVDVLAGRRETGVWHARLFLDRTNRPILPEGEVYDLKPWVDGSSPEKVFR